MAEHPVPDRTLLMRLAAGDASALGALYDRHATGLFRWLLARGLGRGDAEDLLSECFLALADRGARAAQIEDVDAYLFAVARNQLARRGRHPEPEALDLIAEPAASDPLADALAVREALADLPPEQRGWSCSRSGRDAPRRDRAPAGHLVEHASSRCTRWARGGAGRPRMDDRQIEERLRRVRLARPDPALRAPDRSGGGSMRPQARPARFPWALAAAAALLIAANLVFGQVHDTRIRALVGEPATVTAADAQVYAQAIAERARLMSEALDEPWPDAEPQTNSDGGERRGARPVPDRQTYRPLADPRLA